MSKKMIVKGVGQILIKRAEADGKGEEVIKIGSLQDLKFDLDVELEDIYGGDGLFAIDTLVKNKSIAVSATSAKLDLSQVELMMGSTQQTDVASYVWVMGEAKAADASGNITVKFFDTVYSGGDIRLRTKDTNTKLTRVAAALDVDDATKFHFEDSTGVITVDASYDGIELDYDYQRTETVDMVDLLADEVPFNVHILHHGSFLQKDGTFEGIEIEIFQARAKGTFSIDAQRNTASSSQIDLQVIDPERGDGKLGTIKRYSSSERV